MMKINFIRTKGNKLRWRQIEKREGFVFMRMKVRPVVVVTGRQGE